MNLIPSEKTLRRMSTLASCLAVALLASCSHTETKAAGPWNQQAAAAYLDQREAWWMGWQGAARDHETFCVSCHTALPYALSRPTLRKALGEENLSPDEQQLLDNIAKRVRLWKDVGPYYSDQGYDHKTAESRGTEVILNALILASYDARNRRLSDDLRAAFNNMWALQQTTGDGKGAWPWLQFDLAPWEANDSQYYGAALAAVAVGTAPENYRSTPEIQNSLKMLRDYLNHESAKQSTINRVVLLWASTRLPGLLDREQEEAIISEILSKQQADGGWRLASLAWEEGLFSIVRRWIREDGTPFDANSDGYATGLITFVLEEAGIPRENVQLKQGLSWLVRYQNKADGSWSSYSLNKRRNPSSETGRFMSDAATAYAVLALTKNQRGEDRVASLSSR